MKIVTVNGVTYLGTLEETEGGLVVKDAMQFGGQINQGVITEYYKRGNVGKLRTETFGGSGISFGVSELTDEDVMFCKIAELALERAKATALKNLENREFDGVLGKF